MVTGDWVCPVLLTVVSPAVPGPPKRDATSPPAAHVGPQALVRSQVNFKLASLSGRSHLHNRFLAHSCWNARERMASVFRVPAIRDHCRATCLTHISEETVPQRHRQSIAPQSHSGSISLSVCPELAIVEIKPFADYLFATAWRNGPSTTWACSGGFVPADTVRQSSLRGQIPLHTPRG